MDYIPQTQNASNVLLHAPYAQTKPSAPSAPMTSILATISASQNVRTI
jgi:hypothetical protein